MTRHRRCAECDWLDRNLFGLEICGHYISIEGNPGGISLAWMRRTGGRCTPEGKLFVPRDDEEPVVQ